MKFSGMLLIVLFHFRFWHSEKNLSKCKRLKREDEERGEREREIYVLQAFRKEFISDNMRDLKREDEERGERERTLCIAGS